jgi:serine-type D-Ala-D-Ala carboxypeptidase (penicillin-binding protein 5/6)
MFVHTLLKAVSARHARNTSLVFAIAIACLTGYVSPARATVLSSDLVDGKTAAARSNPAAALPSLTMKAGELSDEDGRVIWARKPDQRRAMASLTKMMTAVVALEHSSLNETVTVPREAAQVGQSSAFLVPGQVLRMKDLLAAMLVKSGNDAAITIAIHVGGTEAHFVEMMNAKAAQIGLTETHFANSHGLDAPSHYSSARDLGVLARYAMSKPAFSSTVSETSTVVGLPHHRRRLASTDLLLSTYKGAIGVKTGETNGAGWSVVSAAVREGVTLYAVVLGTASDLLRFRNAADLLDWGFAHYRPQSLLASGTVLGEAPVADYLDRSVEAGVSQDVTATVLDTNGVIRRTVTLAPVRAPVRIGDHVGAVTFTQAGKIIAAVPLVAVQNVPAPNPFEFLWIMLVRDWRAAFG